MYCWNDFLTCTHDSKLRVVAAQCLTHEFRRICPEKHGSEKNQHGKMLTLP